MNVTKVWQNTIGIRRLGRDTSTEESPRLELEPENSTVEPFAVEDFFLHDRINTLKHFRTAPWFGNT